eukprot:5868084-Prymnesium_polylepis.1
MISPLTHHGRVGVMVRTEIHVRSRIVRRGLPSWACRVRRETVTRRSPGSAVVGTSRIDPGSGVHNTARLALTECLRGAAKRVSTRRTRCSSPESTHGSPRRR